MTVKHLYPNSTPALNLNFKSSRVADPRIACARTTTATYVDPVSGLVKTAAANEVRVEKGGLLVEESRTNILTQSNDFTTWLVYNVTINSNVETAPDGTTTASKMQWSSSSNRNMVFLQPTANVTQTHTCSFFAKAAEWNYAVVAIQPPGGGQPRYWITVDLTTGAIEEYSSGGTAPTEMSASATQLPNGWWRVSATANVNAAGKTQVQMEVGMSPNNTFGSSVSGTPDGTSGIYIWGAQHEQGTFLTSYIPTSGSTVQRLADDAEITGTNFSSWYNSSGGTFVFTTSARNSPKIFISQNGSSSNRTELNRSNTQARFTVNSGGAQVTNAETVFSVDNTDQHKIAFRLANPYKMAVNGNSTCSNAGGSFNAPPNPNLNRIDIGINQAGVMQNGPIQNLSFYPSALSDTALETLTK